MSLSLTPTYLPKYEYVVHAYTRAPRTLFPILRITLHIPCFWTCGIFSFFFALPCTFQTHWLREVFMPSPSQRLAEMRPLVYTTTKCSRETNSVFAFFICWPFVYVLLCRVEISEICPPVSESVSHQAYFHFRFFRDRSLLFFLSLILHTDIFDFPISLISPVGIQCSLPRRYISHSPFSLKFVVTFVSSSRIRVRLHPSFFDTRVCYPFVALSHPFSTFISCAFSSSFCPFLKLASIVVQYAFIF